MTTGGASGRKVRKKKAALTTLLIILAGVASWAAWNRWQHGHPPRTALTLYGNIDLREVRLAFKDTERIAHLYVREGDQVFAGEVLAREDTRELNAGLAYARARVAAQRSVLEALEAGSRPQEIRKAEADVRAARSQSQLAAVHLARARKLLRAGTIPPQARDDAQAAARAAAARLEATRQALALLRAGPRSEDVDAARSRLAALQARLQLATDQLRNATLRAPVAGVIESRILEVGDIASPQIPVYTLALTSHMWARVYVDEPVLGHVQAGMAAWVASDSYPGRRYRGVVGYVSPVAEFTPSQVETPEVRTSLVYQVRVNLCPPHPGLRLGMPVTVHLEATGAPSGRVRCGDATTSPNAR